jgi:hypothetical protein|tara:strand:+ start:159 stop:344 length:186 start_codon:yes stop_codon:yes gene_type:complete
MINKKLDDVYDKLDSVLDKLDTINETMLKIWKAEDEEEGEYRWPYNTDGKMMENVSATLKD